MIYFIPTNRPDHGWTDGQKTIIKTHTTRPKNIKGKLFEKKRQLNLAVFDRNQNNYHLSKRLCLFLACIHD